MAKKSEQNADSALAIIGYETLMRRLIDLEADVRSLKANYKGYELDLENIRNKVLRRYQDKKPSTALEKFYAKKD